MNETEMSEFIEKIENGSEQEWTLGKILAESQHRPEGISLSTTRRLSAAELELTKEQLNQKVSDLNKELENHLGQKICATATEAFVFEPHVNGVWKLLKATDPISAIKFAGEFTGMEMYDRNILASSYPLKDPAEIRLGACLVLVPDDRSGHPNSIKSTTFIPLNKLVGPIYEYNVPKPTGPGDSS